MKKINLKLIIFFIAVVGLLIFLHFIKVLSPVEEKISLVGSKIGSNFYSLSSSLRSTYNDQTKKLNFLEIINELEEKNKQLIVENSRLNKLEEENSKLRQHLKFLEEKEQNYVIANVVSRKISANPEETLNDLIIDKGKKDGLVEGLAVIDEGIVVGKLSKVEQNISQVTLKTNSNCKLASTLNNLDKTTGIAQGNLGLTISMNFIPQLEEISKGNLVVTSGLEENIPRGLVIGEILEVDSNSNEIWQNAAIDPLTDFDDLIIVSILLP